MTKAFLLAFLAFASISFRDACGGDSAFIIVTTKTTWDDGMVSNVGEVEQVIRETTNGYVISGVGRNYLVPTENAQQVTAEQAAIALLAQRAILYAYISGRNGAVADSPVLPTPRPQPTQYNGRPLPSNWIDPQQADDNFNAQQLQSEIQRLRQQVDQHR